MDRGVEDENSSSRFHGSINTSAAARSAFRPRALGPRRYTAKEAEPELGLLYFGARYFDPVLGRFISADPAYAEADSLPGEGYRQFLNSPQRGNLYAYALNNPLRFVDADGLDPAAPAGPWQSELLHPSGGTAFNRGLPKEHLKANQVAEESVGSVIIAFELTPEKQGRTRNKDFNTLFVVYDAELKVLGAYRGNLGSQSKYTSGGLATGIYAWKTHIHQRNKEKSQHAALTVTDFFWGSREGLPTVGPNNLNEKYKPNSEHLADYINIHSSGKNGRASAARANIDRSAGDGKNFLNFMSHFPEGSTGVLTVFRSAEMTQDLIDYASSIEE